jgi:DNA-binding IscR family transcriptional regulator
VLLAVWAEVGEHVRSHLDSFTLADMVERARGNAGTSGALAPTARTPAASSPAAVDALV